MATAIQSAEKRPVNLTLNVTLVEQARAYSSNQQTHQQQAAATVAQWNAFHAKTGSFADEHIAL